MNSFIPEEKENPVVTLKAQAGNFNFSMLRAGEGNFEANSGHQAYEDIDRMNFVISGKSIDKIFTKVLINIDKKEFDTIWEEYCKGPKIPSDKKTDQYKEEVEKFYNIGKGHAHLLPKNQNEDYRLFAKEVFKEMFKHAKAEVPSDSILEELVINCNQAGYEAASLVQAQLALGQHSFIIKSPEKVININHISQNNVSVRSDMTLPMFLQKSDGTIGDKVCDLPSSLEFTLESQDGKDGVTYTNGNLSLTVPRELKNYKIDGKNLFDIIKEYFQKFCEKLGFKFEVEIEDGLGDPLEVNSCVEDPNVDHLSNKHGTPGVDD